MKKTKTPKNLLKTLVKYVNKNGFAKTAVVLGYRDTNSIRNWISREEIPPSKRDSVKELSGYCVVVTPVAL